MDNEKLIEDLRGLLKQYGEKIPYGELVGAPWPYSRSGDLVWQDLEPYFIEQAATALSTLQIENQALRNSANGFKAENEKMQKQLNEFSEFLCHMTGGLLSKTNYTAQEMISAADDYQQRVCGECDLRAENEKLRAELEQVKAEQDAAVNEVERVIERYIPLGPFDRLRELAQADREGRCVVLDDLTVADLQQMLTVLNSTRYGDGVETYTTGYRKGHRNGRIEILHHVLGINEGDSAEATLRMEQDE